LNKLRNFLSNTASADLIRKFEAELVIGFFDCVEVKPATPAPTQPSEVGPYKTVPSISCPGFYTLQENRINIFGPAKLRECHDYMAFARKGFALGQSSARSQEGRLREALQSVPKPSSSYSSGAPGCGACGFVTYGPNDKPHTDNCWWMKIQQALTASPEASQEVLI
jgi:hypothetical protein